MRHILFAASAATLLSTALAGCSSTVSRLSDTELNAASAQLTADIQSHAAPITAPLSVYDAMARALKSNLDHRVASLEHDLARADAGLEAWNALPQVVASGAYYGRNNDAGASSLSLLSGRQSLEPSTSTERDYAAGDLTATWNILDFGLSRIRAEQLADEAHILEERRRKAVISVVEDVHAAYWRAISAERLAAKLDALEADVRSAFADARTLSTNGRTAPLPALTFQRELTDIQSQAQRLRREMSEAKAELAALMGLAPGKDFQLVVPARFRAPAPLSTSASEMMDTALRQRPEVREALYRARIGEAELRAATLEAFPSLEGFAGVNASTNDFLFNNDWVAYGARASWNLLKVFQTGKRRERADTLQELEMARARASAMAVMTQVAVSRVRYARLAEEYATAEQGAGVQGEITDLVMKQARASTASRQTLVRERMNAILAEARRDSVHAFLREAEAQVQASMGFDPYPAGITGHEDVATLSAALQQLWEGRL